MNDIVICVMESLMYGRVWKKTKRLWMNWERPSKIVRRLKNPAYWDVLIDKYGNRYRFVRLVENDVFIRLFTDEPSFLGLEFSRSFQEIKDFGIRPLKRKEKFRRFKKQLMAVKNFLLN